MAKELITSSLVAPAFLGLNTQESSVANDPSFALEADNCVIDEFGRLGAREGWFYRTTTGGTGVNLKGIHTFLDVVGINTFLSWSEDTFYKGFTTLSTITPTTVVPTTVAPVTDWKLPVVALTIVPVIVAPDSEVVKVPVTPVIL